jgi:type 1 glutamine amidotransferase
MNEDLNVAVITGGHAFDVPGFTRLWRALPGVDAYIQDLENWADADAATRDGYDALAFYNMHRGAPSGKVLAALERALASGQGIVALHHGILAFDQWAPWHKLTGLTWNWDDFAYAHDQRVPLHVTDAAHPITQGIADWEMVDETYLMPDTDGDSHVLITTTHPQCMSTIAWTRHVGDARVFCYESGHDDQAYRDPSFRTVLARGTAWACNQ